MSDSDPSLGDLILQVPLYRRLAAEDRVELAACCRVERYSRGAMVFAESDAGETFFTIVEGRIKVSKAMPDGRVIILEIFGAGDPVGAVAVFEDLEYPATAVALEPTVCLCMARSDLFRLLERRPSLVRGLLGALTHRLMSLTNRLAERTGGKVESRLARLFVKLSEEIGTPMGAAVFIPMALSRQELADLVGTTVETSIRIMSRWGKEGIVTTEKDGFRVDDIAALGALGQG